jgi:hypothetical protein
MAKEVNYPLVSENRTADVCRHLPRDRRIVARNKVMGGVRRMVVPSDLCGDWLHNEE